MKSEESVRLRRTSVNGLFPPPTIQHSTSGSNRRPSMQSNSKQLLQQKDNIVKFELDNPAIFKQEKYKTLYNEILKDMKSMDQHLNNQSTSIEKNKIKKSIARVISLNEEEGDFNERFGDSQRFSKSRSRQKKQLQSVGMTDLERQSQKRKAFFNDHKKVIDLQQECMLLEYYLKDQQHEKTQLSYLTGLQPTSRHRRITPTAKDISQLYNTHDERQYRSLKKRVHLKEQFVQKCCLFAKRNSTYRRRQNFKQIQFVLKEHNKSLMEETIVLEEIGEQQQEKLKENNKMRRLYLHYGFIDIQPKVDQHKTDASLKKFKENLFQINQNYPYREKQIDRKIEQIFEFKHQRVIQFHDFKELMFYLNKLLKTNVLKAFQQKFPHFLTTNKDLIIAEHWQQIDKYFSKTKIKFMLQVMFKTFPQKLIGKKLLPIKVIPSILKTYGISEKDFKIQELFHNFHWVQHYDTGLLFEQFYQGLIRKQMKGNDWRGLEVFLKKVNIKKYLL